MNKQTLTAALFDNRGYVISPRWISNTAWMIDRRLVESPVAEILESSAAMEALFNASIHARFECEDFCVKVLADVPEATIEHRVTNRVVVATPTTDLVFLDPIGLLNRRYVEGFGLWGKTLLAARDDGRSTLFLIEDGEPVLSIMPCKPEPEYGTIYAPRRGGHLEVTE